jgi:hypothetical protein
MPGRRLVCDYCTFITGLNALDRSCIPLFSIHVNEPHVLLAPTYGLIIAKFLSPDASSAHSLMSGSNDYTDCSVTWSGRSSTR